MAISAMSGLPILNLVARNPDAVLPYGRLVTYWIGLTSISIAGVAVFSRTRTALALSGGRGGALAALFIYVLTFLTSSIDDRLGLVRVLGVEGEVWLALGLMIVAVLMSRSARVRATVPVFAVLTLLVPLFQIVFHDAAAAREHPGLAQPWSLTRASTPNIYAFVLDGYGRLSILEEAGLEDPYEVAAKLETRGFAVPRRATSGYSASGLSISSTLSGDYLPDAAMLPQTFLSSRVSGDNPVVATVRSWGYSYVHGASNGWWQGQCEGWEDICLYPSGWDEVDWELLEMTPFAEPIEKTANPHAHAGRADPRHAVGHLRTVGPPEPFFALFHLLNPHPPYTHLGEECAVQEFEYELATPWGSDEEYAEAVLCLNGFLVSAVDRIISEDPTAVIVIHGDHGPGSELDFARDLDEWTDVEMDKRLGIFAALRLPSDCPVPDDLASVNIYRLVLGCLAEEEMELLQGRSWMVDYQEKTVREVVHTG